jgi:hypothetical protein
MNHPKRTLALQSGEEVKIITNVNNVGVYN